jgi:formylglycine-generating enzyme required for sulfatase activity
VGYYDGSNHGGYQTLDSPSPYDLYDVVGNVQEWCSTKSVIYPYDSNDGRENPPVSYSECCRVLRGGTYGPSPDGQLQLWCANRGNKVPSFRNGGNGFRCARTG